MAYLSKNLSVLAYANGFTLWHYTTPDTAAAVDTAGYFNSASEMLRVGDMILANVETEGTPVPTVGLAELGVEPAAFGAELLRRYAEEVEDIWLARCKGRAVS